MNPTGEQSEVLGLPFILPSQAQKHITHNEAIQMLDALVQLGVRDDALGGPPASPVPGDRYIVGPNASGAWEGREGEIAAWQGGAWLFYLPRDGWLAHVARDDRMVRYRDNAWGPLPASGVTRTERIGVNTDATETNRLTVSADATLLTAETNDHRLVVNRTGDAATASLVFQSDFSGRAEMGLAGGSRFGFKVSVDGAAWSDALALEPGAIKLFERARNELPDPATIGAGGLAWLSGTGLVASDGTDWRTIALGGAV